MDNGKKKKKKIVIFEPLDELGPLLLSSQCGPTRVRLVDEQLVGRLLPGSGAVEQPDEATCSQVVGLLMSTLRLWFDPKSVQSVQRAVSTLARQNPALCVPVLADMSTRMSKRTFGDKSKSPDRDGRVALNLAGVHAQLLLALAPDVEKVSWMEHSCIKRMPCVEPVVPAVLWLCDVCMYLCLGAKDLTDGVKITRRGLGSSYKVCCRRQCWFSTGLQPRQAPARVSPTHSGSSLRTLLHCCRSTSKLLWPSPPSSWLRLQCSWTQQVRKP